MSKNILKGVLAPVLTPFKADLSPDKDRFVAHCKWLLSQISAIAIFGTNSEANSLAAEERIMLLEALVAAGIDTSRVLAGTGCCSITDSVKLTTHAVKHGCAGVLMLPPFYYKGVSEEGLYRNYSEVIQRVGDSRLRLYFYHIPHMAVIGITPGLVERLLKTYPAVVAGLKDSSRDWNNTKLFLDAFTKQGFDVFVGSDSQLLINMRHGGVGCISGMVNVNPAGTQKLYNEWQSPDADQQQAALNAVRDAVGKKRAMIPALKQTVAIYANDPVWGNVRPPLVGLTAEQAQALAADLKQIGFTMPGLTRTGNSVTA